MNRIKQLRKNKRLTLAELSQDLDLSKGTLSRYENGIITPKKETWQALADYFNVSVPYLQGATTYEFLDHKEKGIYDHVSEAMDRAFDDYAFLPETKERVLKAIAYSIDNGEIN